jgi:hypothetical protein
MFSGQSGAAEESLSHLFAHDRYRAAAISDELPETINRLTAERADSADSHWVSRVLTLSEAVAKFPSRSDCNY